MRETVMIMPDIIANVIHIRHHGGISTLPLPGNQEGKRLYGIRLYTGVAVGARG